MKKKGSVFLLIAFIFLMSCSHKINPEKPLLSQTNFKLDSLPNSEINIPIQISLRPLYAMAEKMVDIVFTSHNYPNDWVTIGCDSCYIYWFCSRQLLMTASGT